MLHLRFNNFLIVILLFLTINGSRSEKIARAAQDIQLQQKYNAKRGISGANDFGPPIHVSSGILELEHSKPSSSGSVQQSHVAESNPWQGSDLSAGYEVWLGTASGGLYNEQPIHVASGGIPLGGIPTTTVVGSDVGSIFSINQVHTSYEQPSEHTIGVPMTGVPTIDGHLSGVLHTQISSSRPYDPTSVVTGNVDFSNDASLKRRYPSLSYGR